MKYVKLYESFQEEPELGFDVDEQDVMNDIISSYDKLEPDQIFWVLNNTEQGRGVIQYFRRVLGSEEKPLKKILPGGDYSIINLKDIKDGVVTPYGVGNRTLRFIYYTNTKIMMLSETIYKTLGKKLYFEKNVHWNQSGTANTKEIEILESLLKWYLNKVYKCEISEVTWATFNPMWMGESADFGFEEEEHPGYNLLQSLKNVDPILGTVRKIEQLVERRVMMSDLEGWKGKEGTEIYLYFHPLYKRLYAVYTPNNKFLYVDREIFRSITPYLQYSGDGKPLNIPNVSNSVAQIYDFVAGARFGIDIVQVHRTGIQGWLRDKISYKAQQELLQGLRDENGEVIKESEVFHDSDDDLGDDIGFNVEEHVGFKMLMSRHDRKEVLQYLDEHFGSLEKLPKKRTMFGTFSFDYYGIKHPPHMHGYTPVICTYKSHKLEINKEMYIDFRKNFFQTGQSDYRTKSILNWYLGDKYHFDISHVVPTIFRGRGTL